MVNYGRPYDLLQNSSSILFDFVNKLGKDEQKQLLEIAEAHVFNKDKQLLESESKIFTYCADSTENDPLLTRQNND